MLDEVIPDRAADRTFRVHVFKEIHLLTTFFFFHTNMRTETFASLITCVIDDN